MPVRLRRMHDIDSEPGRFLLRHHRGPPLLPIQCPLHPRLRGPVRRGACGALRADLGRPRPALLQSARRGAPARGDAIVCRGRDAVQSAAGVCRGRAGAGEEPEGRGSAPVRHTGAGLVHARPDVLIGICPGQAVPGGTVCWGCCVGGFFGLI